MLNDTLSTVKNRFGMPKRTKPALKEVCGISSLTYKLYLHTNNIHRPCIVSTSQCTQYKQPFTAPPTTSTTEIYLYMYISWKDKGLRFSRDIGIGRTARSLFSSINRKILNYMLQLRALHDKHLRTPAHSLM